MEYLVLVTTPFSKGSLEQNLRAYIQTISTRTGTRGATGPSCGAPFNGVPTYSSFPASMLGFASQSHHSNLDFTLRLRSSRGGVDVDYYQVDNRTLVYDKHINFSYWQEPQENMAVTAQQLKAICPTASVVNIQKHVEHLNATMRKYGINTRLRQAHFLAQLSHESDHFRTAREYHSGANYEMRSDIGNTRAGDGKRFRGRGLIQLTGRDVYTAYEKYVGRNLTDGENPKLLEEEPLASDSAGWFWQVFKRSKNLNARADRNDIEAVTRAVNGGLRGLAARRVFFENAKNTFGLALARNS